MPDVLTPPAAAPPAANAASAPPPAPLRLAARRTARRGWGRLALAVLALAIVAAIIRAMIPDPVPVELVRVTRGPMQATVHEDGRTRVRDRYEIAAPVAGTLLRVEAEAGDSVRRGQVLARIAPLAAPLLDARTRAEVTAHVAAAEAAVAQARTAVSRAADAAAVAGRDAERQRALLAAGAASIQVADQTDLIARTRQEELAAARAGVRVAEADLASRRATLAGLAATGRSAGGAVAIRAPADGVVLSVRRESEGPVGVGQPVVVIGDPRALEIELDLLTADAALVRAGAPVTIEQWGGPGDLRGHVRRIEPAAFTRLSALGVEEQRVNVIIDLDEPRERWAGLGDGYRVEGRVLVWAAEDVVRVPASAVFRNGDGWAAFRLDDGRARLVTVATGRRTDALVEVADGLAEGDQVVAYPGEQVRDGVRIAPR